MTDLPGARLTEEQRRPLVDDEGRRLLLSLLEHESAPRFNHTCGDRLTEAGLAEVLEFERAVGSHRPRSGGGRPDWVEAFAARCLRDVPVYRKLGVGAGAAFETIPTTGRDALVRTPWAFVPDGHPLDEMVVFTTTGTSGGDLAYVPSTPATAASYAVLLRAALATRGLSLSGGPGRTAVALVCWQKRTYTYASVSTFLGQGAIMKINLNPAEWNDPADVVTYLDHADPEVITGDPIAFSRLADLSVAVHPTAMLSTAMTLTAGLRERLEARFGCPVIDVYGMSEAGPIAAATADGTAHVPLQPRLFIEVLGPDGRPLGVGARGEITLTGGFNPALPLLRYRTGDHASLDAAGRLVGFEGRAPIAFAAADGRAVNTIDVTVALHRFELGRYRVHQAGDQSLTVGLEWAGRVDEDGVRAALADLFGPVPVTVEAMTGEPEQVRYSSDL